MADSPSAQQHNWLSHHFVLADGACKLIIDVPFLSSMDDVELDVGDQGTRVRMAAHHDAIATLIYWPIEAKGRRIDEAYASWSQKRGQLIVTLPCSSSEEPPCTEDGKVAPASMKTGPEYESAGKVQDAGYNHNMVAASIELQRDKDDPHSQLSNTQVVGRTHTTECTKRVTENPNHSVTTSKPTPEDKVHGSIWNVNSWHWEERPMTKWSQKWFEEELASVSEPLLENLAVFSFFDTSDVLKGDVSLCVRKGRPVVLFEITVVCRWQAMPHDEQTGFARGKMWIRDFTSEDNVDSADIDMDVNIDKSKGRCLSKAVQKDGLRAAKMLLGRFVGALKSQLPKQSV